ncbi:MAG: Gfo/Idh/MocA family oxidoreductase [Candidatus Binatus sp.]|uniref:Gfo/Idh/MocA family protein n=1 Tax=Candidatus Binatus sp. TaxID=2811406 RepID=UPI00271FB7BE|nr:Gfo/Idh/MocA family oxidoreductase [Candidatus Binatus sp.]MDO8432383.1 Gfo/Idh/MocA family oxidoreductase [Candidatus Binatus sp.]
MTTEIAEQFTKLTQSWPRPTAPKPIVVIGAGSIVRDAHLPIYGRLEFPVAGIFDLNADIARERAKEFSLPRVFTNLAEAAAVSEAVFDIAIPPANVAGVLEHLPVGAAVLIQKPMGRDLADARRIAKICRERRLVAKVNFQLRFAPNMLAIRDALARGLFGDILDVEVRINLHTPWNYWAFLKNVPRLEVLMHSIHYIDLIRSILGQPRGVYCRGVRHPEMREYADTRTSIILDYGDTIRCSLTMNHAHRFGGRYAMSQLKIEGTRAAAIAQMGVNLNYPAGESDTLEIAATDSDWSAVPLRGSWFLEAFEGPMSNLQRYAAGEDATLISGVDDALKTMAIVEACYESSAEGGTPIPPVK